VKKWGANVEAFLKFAGGQFDAIPDNRYDALDALLTRKRERQRRSSKERSAKNRKHVVIVSTANKILSIARSSCGNRDREQS